MSQNEKIQNLTFGRWVALPIKFYQLLEKGVLTQHEFLVFQFIFTTLYAKNSFTGNFSCRHLARKLSISDRTARNSLRSLEGLGLILRHFNHDNYGEVYTLSETALNKNMSELEGSETATTPAETATTPAETATTHTETATTHTETATTNIDYYYNYINLSIGNSISHFTETQKIEFSLDCQRLIDAGFTVENIMTFLKLRLQKGPIQPSKVETWYGLIKAYSKASLDLTAKSLEKQEAQIEARRLENQKLLASVGAPKITPNHVKKGETPSFKIQL